MMAASPVYEPMSYAGPNDAILGYDIELAHLVCKELGYRLEITGYTTDSLISAVESGKADFGETATTITEERTQKVDFSTPIYHGAVVLSVRDTSASAQAEQGFFEGLISSFSAGEQGRDVVLDADYRDLVRACGGEKPIALIESDLSKTILVGVADVEHGDERELVAFRVN